MKSISDYELQFIEKEERSKEAKKILITVIVIALSCFLIIIIYKPPRAAVPPRGGPYHTAAVSSDGTPCAQIAVGILKEGGKAADAAIAASICSGVVNPHSMGLGGGFVLTYYNRAEGRAYTLNSREVAPGAATKDMFDGNASLSLTGGLAVAVPGQLRGYQSLYKRFGGGVPWERLFDNSIALAEMGHPVSAHLAMALEMTRNYILQEPTLKIYVNQSTGDVLQEGDVLHQLQLAATLRTIQKEPDAIHHGSLTAPLVEDLETMGGIVTARDLNRYTPEWNDSALHIHLEDPHLTMYTIQSPASGAIFAFIMKLLNGYHFTKESLSRENRVLTFQRIIETFKYGYGFRTWMGDKNFVNVDNLVRDMTSESFTDSIRSVLLENTTSRDPEYYGAHTQQKRDHGTSHVSVLAPNGDAVAMTSTINCYFGALIASKRTGIILNNEMDDFSSPDIVNHYEIPPSPANFIVPGKRPLSSMCPSVLVAPNGDVRLVIGGAGGTKITSAVALTAIQHLWFGRSIDSATQAHRLHHQLYPMAVSYEEGFSEEVLRGLRAKNHLTRPLKNSAVVSPLARGEDGYLYAARDGRKSGQVDGY